MPMKRSLFLLTIACIISGLYSCHTSEEAVVSRSPHQPKFINNVYIDPHAKTSSTANAIDRTKRPERPRTDNKPIVHYAKQTQAVTTTPKPAVAAVEEVTPEKPEESGLKKKYAEIIGLSPAQLVSITLYKFIDKWYGTNYRIGGCQLNGIDCSGFAQKLYSDVYGIDLLRTAMDQFTNCKRIKNATDAVEGDLVFFHIRSKRISHVGVYLGNNYFVHASTSNGVMISSLEEEYWHKYYAGCGRIPRS